MCLDYSEGIIFTANHSERIFHLQIVTDIYRYAYVVGWSIDPICSGGASSRTKKRGYVTLRDCYGITN